MTTNNFSLPMKDMLEMFFDINANILASLPSHSPLSMKMNKFKFLFNRNLRSHTRVRLAVYTYELISTIFVNIKRKYWNSEFPAYSLYRLFFLLLYLSSHSDADCDMNWKSFALSRTKTKWNEMIFICVLCIPLPYNNIIFNLRSRANLNIGMQVWKINRPFAQKGALCMHTYPYECTE